MASAAQGWEPGSLINVLRTMGLSPQATEPEPGDDVRIIAAHDAASRLNFGVIYLVGPGGAMNDLSLICAIPDAGGSEEKAAAIDARLAIASAFFEDGLVWIFAELNTARPFTEAFFRAQVTFYLGDMRMALQLLEGADAPSMRAMRAFLGIRQRRGLASPMVRALSNAPGMERAQRQPPVISAAPCPRCRGTGRLFLRPCGDCAGSGAA